MLLKKNCFLLLLNLLIISLLFLLFAPQYQFIYFINSAFYITACYVFILIFLFITNGRFFDGLVFSARRFNRSVSKRKQRDYLNESTQKRLPSEMVNHNFYKLIAFQGITLSIIQITLLFAYYIR